MTVSTCVHVSDVGVTASGQYCVRFGLVTADTDLEELIAMVYVNGKEVEESSKVCRRLVGILRSRFSY